MFISSKKNIFNVRNRKINYLKKFYGFNLDGLRRQGSEWGCNAFLGVQQMWMPPQNTICNRK
jgi:hypothetical protein